MEQTIVAQASASGKAGIGIVRLSGGKSLMIAKQMLHLSPKPRYAHYGGFFNQDGELIDKEWLFFILDRILLLERMCWNCKRMGLRWF